MGKLALAAKATHVPSMYRSEQPGPDQGCREAAIEGNREIARRARALGVDTVVVLDTHWMVNTGYHVNCNRRFEGVYSSHELPHFISDMGYAYPGNPALGRAIAEMATRHGLVSRANEIDSLTLEYGTLMPMRYMNADQHFRVVSCAAWCARHPLQDSRRFGAALREAIEASEFTVMVLASGGLSHRFQNSDNAFKGRFKISSEFNYQVDQRVLELWRTGQWKAFCEMLPDYAWACQGEGGMHDIAMLLGMLGWDEYERGVEILTDYFASSGTGQVTAIFPVD